MRCCVISYDDDCNVLVCRCGGSHKLSDIAPGLLFYSLGWGYFSTYCNTSCCKSILSFTLLLCEIRAGFKGHVLNSTGEGTWARGRRRLWVVGEVKIQSEGTARALISNGNINEQLNNPLDFIKQTADRAIEYPHVC